MLFLNIFLVGKAQILDTISLQEFKDLKYKQVKALFENDEDGLDLIKKSHTRKINSYVFFGLSVPLAVTLNPTIWIPLTPAVIKLSNNTQKSLYNKLRYYERVKYNLDTVVLKSTKDSNINFYKYANSTFDIDLKDFVKLTNKELIKNYGFNDTAKWIIEYSKGNNINKNSVRSIGIISIMLGGLSYYYTIYYYINHVDFPPQAGIFTGTPLIIGGIYLWHQANQIKASNIEIFYNLQHYYLNHTVPKEIEKFIKNKREKYKPRPLF